MSKAVKHPSAAGKVEAILDDALSDAEMDEALADRRSELEAKLREAHEDRVRGDFAPLEPLGQILRDARRRRAGD